MKNAFKPKRIGAGYLLRWHLIPRNPWFNVYLHKFIGDDDDRALHDHPWCSLSLRLKGMVIEHHNSPLYYESCTGDIYGAITMSSFSHPAPRLCFRPATHAHRLELVGNKPCWTLFITGPRKREWGFHCPNGWQHWSTMTAKDGRTIGGCE